MRQGWIRGLDRGLLTALTLNCPRSYLQRSGTQGRTTHPARACCSILLEQMAASLSRPVSRPALITSCSPFCAGADDATRGSRFSSRSAKPPHDGMRRMGRYNLSGALAADQRQDRRPLRTHPTRRPREDIFLPEQNGLSPCLQFSWVLRRRFRQPWERRRCPCSSGTRYRRPRSGAEPQPGAWRPRRWRDVSRAVEPPAGPTPSATTISCSG
jgi:hypothetical protein